MLVGARGERACWLAWVCAAVAMTNVACSGAVIVMDVPSAIDAIDAQGVEDAGDDLADEVQGTDVVDVPRAESGGLVSVRPYRSQVPTRYNPATPTPLIILLHGYGASGALQDIYFGLGRVARDRGFLFANPDGTTNAAGQRFWNATNACCDFALTGVDDVAYINAIIDDMSARYNVDPRRIYLVGHSNGGFMSHRMACDASNRIAAIVSVAGAMWSDMSRCQPTSPVSVLQVHGTLDAVIAYNGGMQILAMPGMRTYPSARASVDTWARLNRCGPLTATTERIDLDIGLFGSETRVDRATGCAGGAAELWSIEGGSHIPGFGPEWPGLICDWLSAHPRAM